MGEEGIRARPYENRCKDEGGERERSVNALNKHHNINKIENLGALYNKNKRQFIRTRS